MKKPYPTKNLTRNAKISCVIAVSIVTSWILVRTCPESLWSLVGPFLVVTFLSVPLSIYGAYVAHEETGMDYPWRIAGLIAKYANILFSVIGIGITLLVGLMFL